jgi:hypothetical protein
MPPRAPSASFLQFVEDYRRLRLSEGFASADRDFVRHLPFRDSSRRKVVARRLRAVYYLVTRTGLAVMPGMRHVLDVGTGNGWRAGWLARATTSWRSTSTPVTPDAGLVGRLRGREAGPRLPVRIGFKR